MDDEVLDLPLSLLSYLGDEAKSLLTLGSDFEIYVSAPEAARSTRPTAREISRTLGRVRVAYKSATPTTTAAIRDLLDELASRLSSYSFSGARSTHTQVHRLIEDYPTPDLSDPTAKDYGDREALHQARLEQVGRERLPIAQKSATSVGARLPPGQMPKRLHPHRSPDSLRLRRLEVERGSGSCASQSAGFGPDPIHSIYGRQDPRRRRWISDGSRGAAHAILAMLSSIGLAVFLIIASRYRSGYAFRHPYPAPLQTEDQEPPYLWIWLVGPLAAVVGLIMVLISGRSEEVLTLWLLIFVLLPFLIIFIGSRLLRRRWRNHPSEYRYDKPPTFDECELTAVRLAGNIAGIAAVVVGGLSLIRAYVPLVIRCRHRPPSQPATGLDVPGNRRRYRRRAMAGRHRRRPQNGYAADPGQGQPGRPTHWPPL